MLRKLFLALGTLLLIVAVTLYFGFRLFASKAIQEYLVQKDIVAQFEVSHISMREIVFKNIRLGQHTFIPHLAIGGDKLWTKQKPTNFEVNVESLDLTDLQNLQKKLTDTIEGSEKAKSVLKNSAVKKITTKSTAWIEVMAACSAIKAVGLKFKLGEVVRDGKKTQLNLEIVKQEGMNSFSFQTQGNEHVHPSAIQLGLDCENKLKMNLSSNSISTKTQPPMELENVSMELEFKPDHVDEQKIVEMKGRLNIKPFSEPFIFNSEANLDVLKAQGKWAIKNVSFAEAGPYLEKWVKNPSGTLNLNGEFHSDEGGFHVRTEVNGQDLCFSYDDIKIENVNFNKLVFHYPEMRSAKKQKITVERVHLGTPIQNIVFIGQIKRPEEIFVDSLAFEVVDAKVDSNSFTLRPQQKRFTPLELKVQNWELQKFLSLFYNEGVSASGTLDGSLKLAFVGPSLVIESGELTNTGSKGGFVRVRPTGSVAPSKNSFPTDTKAILDGYLYDFRYKDMNLQMRSDKDYKMKMTLRAFGKNPNYLDGKPLKLSINFDLNILDSIKSLMLTYDMPERIKNHFLKVEKKAAQ